MDAISGLVDHILALTGMDAVDALRTFYILGTCTILAVSLLPAALSSRFIVYGPRATSTSTTTTTSTSAAQKSHPASVDLTPPASSWLDRLAAWKVPHSFFIQFYVVSVCSSVFWAIQLLTQGPVYRAITGRINADHLQQSMSLHQVIVCWLLLLVQGSRRLYECFAFSKPSSSQMWVGPWLVGVAFYLATGIAIWIEGSGSLVSEDLTLDHFKITTVPSMRTLLCIPLFLMASGIQHDCHHYLFSLKKYTLPTHPLFCSIVCPHYTGECAIYLSLALLSAPQGQLVNKTLLSCLIFVAVNLGVTAATSRKWYVQKFGPESMQGRWNMIPWVY